MIFCVTVVLLFPLLSSVYADTVTVYVPLVVLLASTLLVAVPLVAVDGEVAIVVPSDSDQ